MRVSDFSFELPDELIARFPLEHRTDSRLMLLDAKTGDIVHKNFTDLPALLVPGDLLVFNDTKVIPARLFAKKQTGGRVEILVERILGKAKVLSHIRSSKSPKPGSYIELEDGSQLKMLEREGTLYLLEYLSEEPVSSLLKRLGHIPIPPYMNRDDQLSDQDRYQTVYAKVEGAVAAPTAGLHFDEVIMKQLALAGIGTGWVTLHVGAGTFQPVKVENVEEHKMHSEYLEVSPETVSKVIETRRNGGRVIAVGTTSLRALESASKKTGTINAFCGESDIFIFPGYQFHSVDALITNFHLSESTLIMLVSAFAGRSAVLNAYIMAMKEKYRFFSYGDAMFIS